MSGKSTSITTDPNTVQNYRKLTDLVIKIELTRAILMSWLKFSEKFNHQFSHVFFIFGNQFPESLGFVAMPVTSWIKDTCSNLSLSNQWLRTKMFNFVTGTAPQRNRNSREACSKYKHIQKSRVVFLRKFENRGIKISL